MRCSAPIYAPLMDTRHYPRTTSRQDLARHSLVAAASPWLIQHCPEFHLSSSQFNRFRERGCHPDYRSSSFGLAKFWDLAVLVNIGRFMGRAASTRLSVL